MFLLYILKSEKTNRFYIGVTQDLNDRLERHNGGRSKATKAGAPWRVVHTEEYETRSAALVRERQLKRWKNRERIEALIAS